MHSRFYKDYQSWERKMCSWSKISWSTSCQNDKTPQWAHRKEWGYIWSCVCPLGECLEVRCGLLVPAWEKPMALITTSSKARHVQNFTYKLKWLQTHHKRINCSAFGRKQREWIRIWKVKRASSRKVQTKERAAEGSVHDDRKEKWLGTQTHIIIRENILCNWLREAELKA